MLNKWFVIDHVLRLVSERGGRERGSVRREIVCGGWRERERERERERGSLVKSAISCFSLIWKNSYL